MNKLCHVFDVNWMSGKCLQYFEQAFQTKDAGGSSYDMTFLFEEAIYFSEQGRSGSLLEIWRRNTGEETLKEFTRKYLKTASVIPNTTLVSLMDLTEDHSIYLDIIRSQINETQPTLDRISRFLLLNINLVDYFDDHSPIITEIFDIILDNEESADWGIFHKLYRRVTKEYLL